MIYRVGALLPYPPLPVGPQFYAWLSVYLVSWKTISLIVRRHQGMLLLLRSPLQTDYQVLKHIHDFSTPDCVSEEWKNNANSQDEYALSRERNDLFTCLAELIQREQHACS